jgi:hypothetical protein
MFTIRISGWLTGMTLLWLLVSTARSGAQQYNLKWGSCLSTVATTGCGLCFECESVKGDIEWVA